MAVKTILVSAMITMIAVTEVGKEIIVVILTVNVGITGTDTLIVTDAKRMTLQARLIVTVEDHVAITTSVAQDLAPQ
jgi:hypothetical protein